MLEFRSTKLRRHCGANQDPKNCMVVEDSMIGLNAALGAGMQCIVTYTSSTKGEDFKGAKMVVSALGADPPNCVTVDTLRECMG